MDLRYGVAVLRNIVLHYVKIGAMAALTFSLSGCIKVSCSDGSFALDEFGREVTVARDNPVAEADARRKYCPRNETTTQPPPLPPTPTNFAPALGGVVIGVAALGLGGGGGGETPAVQPTPPTQTPGRPATSTR